MRQVLLADGQLVFLTGPLFRPTLRLTRLKMSEIILTGHKTQIKIKIISKFVVTTANVQKACIFHFLTKIAFVNSSVSSVATLKTLFFKVL